MAQQFQFSEYRGTFPESEGKASGSRVLKLVRFFIKKKIPRKEMTAVIGQMADLLEAGLPLLQTLRLIGRQAVSSNVQEVLREIASGVAQGQALSSALGSFPELFSATDVQLIRAGEEAADLNGVLRSLGEFREKDLETREKWKAALVYPGFVLAMGLLSVWVTLAFVIPQLSVLFEDFEGTLPWPTAILLQFGRILSGHWAMILAMMAVALGVLRWKLTRFKKKGINHVLNNLPFWGRWFREMSTAKYLKSLALLLRNGVAVQFALTSADGLLGTADGKGKSDLVRRKVGDGENLSRALREAGIFSVLQEAVLKVSEEAGNPAAGLAKVAENMEREAWRKMSVITRLLEPLLLLGVGMVVGFMALAMLLPILRMNLSIN